MKEFILRPSEWYPYFAWLPVQVTGDIHTDNAGTEQRSTHWRWLCWVERRRIGRIVTEDDSSNSQGDLLTVWEYRDDPDHIGYNHFETHL